MALKETTENKAAQMIAVSDVQQNTLSLSVSKKTTAGDETSRHQENEEEPQQMPELEASDQKEVAAQDYKEAESTLHKFDGEKSHDSGPAVALDSSEGQQTVLETKAGDEEITSADGLQQKDNWETVSESKEIESVGCSTQNADGGNSESQRISQEQADQAVADAEESLKTDRSEQQGRDDAGEKEIKRELTDEQHTMSRL